MPETEAADMGPQGVMNQSTGGNAVAHDAWPGPASIQRPDGKAGLGVNTPLAMGQAYLPSPFTFPRPRRCR